MRDRQLTRRLLAAFMLILFLAFYAGTHYFAHAHVVDGVTIVHSHPSKSPAHSHSDVQIMSIAAVSAVTTDEPDYQPCVESCPQSVTLIKSTYVISAGHMPSPGIESLPSPPVYEMI